MNQILEHNPSGVSDLEILATATIPCCTLNRLWKRTREYKISQGRDPGKDMDIIVPVASYALEATKIFIWGLSIYETFFKNA